MSVLGETCSLPVIGRRGNSGGDGVVLREERLTKCLRAVLRWVLRMDALCVLLPGASWASSLLSWYASEAEWQQDQVQMMKRNPKRMVAATMPLMMYAMTSPLAEIIQGDFPRDEVGNQELKLGLVPKAWPIFILYNQLQIS